MHVPFSVKQIPTTACRSLAVLSVSLSCAVSALAADAQTSGGEAEQTAAIRATADAFIKAFNAGDAKAVAALWTPDGTVADENGVVSRGRQVIENEYATLFKAQPEARIEISVQSVDLPAPNVAIENGTATVVIKRGVPPTTSRYTAVHILEGGQWLMANVVESPVEVQSNYARLQELDSLIGKWEAKSEDVTAQSDIHWFANKSFIQRDYTVRKNGLTTTSGIQIIGWDPQAGQIRSWSFDSTGGYGSGVWSTTAEGWQIDHIGTLADGTPTSSRDFVIRVSGEDNVFGWRSTNRMAGQSVLPNTAEIVFDRVKDKP